MEMKEKKIPSAVSYYVVAAASIFWAMSLPLYEVAHFVSFGIVMLLLFITSWQIWPKKIQVEMKVKKVEDKKAKEQDVPNATAKKVILKKLKKGKTYFIAVQAYTDDVSGDWSKTVKVKVKK